MASKGQKFIKYSEEIKEEILSKYLKGEGTPTTLGKDYKNNKKLGYKDE